MSRDASAGRASVVGLLWAFSFLSYLLRLNITVAQQYIAHDFGFNDIQIGFIFTAFLVGYTLFQFPGGLAGDEWGPRIALGLCGVLSAVTTALTGFLPGRLWSGPMAVLLVLIGIRFLFGMATAATYPVAMTAVSGWFSPRQHAFISSLVFTGSGVGSAFAPPLVAEVMTAYGWRVTFYVTAMLPLVVATVWIWQTKSMKLVKALAPLTNGRSWWQLFQSRSIFCLCLSYFLYCYSISIFVYWLFKYLVDVKHLSIINSGWVNSLPWVAASVMVPTTGYLSVQYSDRVGFFRGRRRIASSLLLVAALLLWVGAQAGDIRLAIGAMAISVGLLFSTESSYFSTAIQLAGRDAGAASGLMNLAGNLGGIAATSAVPLLVIHFGWLTALLSGSLLAVLAALAWYGMRPPGVKAMQEILVTVQQS